MHLYLRPFTSLYFHLHTLTSANLPLHFTAPIHLHIYITSMHPHCRSFISVLFFFLSFYIFFLSFLCIYIFAYSHPQIYLHISTNLYRTYTSTLSLLHIHFLFLFLYIFSQMLDNYISRFRANLRLVNKDLLRNGIKDLMQQ